MTARKVFDDRNEIQIYVHPESLGHTLLLDILVNLPGVLVMDRKMGDCISQSHQDVCSTAETTSRAVISVDTTSPVTLVLWTCGQITALTWVKTLE